MANPQPVGTILGLDVGDKRIGVARASSLARLSEPLLTLNRSDSIMAEIKALVNEQKAVAVVVGLPRGLSGQSTDQTKRTLEFIAQLQTELDIPVYKQDEAVTSIKAEAELKARQTTSTKADVDALAACYILEDFMSEMGDLGT